MFPKIFTLGAILSASCLAQSPAGSEACAPCHSEIFRSCQKTAMATASGEAADGLITGEFHHKQSGVTYSVSTKGGLTLLRYQREKENFGGQRELLYFIGSGVKGRSYLFSTDGFLFETPINWYTQEHRWNMTPAYSEAREIPLNLPSYVDCLNCHTSGLQPPVAGTDSKFNGKPFLHAGITCERCHGSGDAHLDGKGPIVNPAKLPAARRDAICMECHFEGTVAVEQPGKHLYEFQPGDKLSDFAHYFVYTSPAPAPETTQALSQVEALSLSMCKKKSGDKMWCGSCHDPHSQPTPADRVSFYRGKCLACHGEAFGAKHHRDKPDCTRCHMPVLPNDAVADTESTDHRILKYPTGFQFSNPATEPRLTAFPAADSPLVTSRDLALAWETLAESNREGAQHQAQQSVRKALKQRPDDPRLLSAMGFIDQQHGHDKEARDLYKRALRIDPLANDVATNLGALEARAGNSKRAVELWQAAFERVPNRSSIGIDLAMAFCVAGKRDQARRYIQRVLEFNPDFAIAKRLSDRLNEDPVKCRP